MKHTGTYNSKIQNLIPLNSLILTLINYYCLSMNQQTFNLLIIDN